MHHPLAQTTDPARGRGAGPLALDSRLRSNGNGTQLASAIASWGRAIMRKHRTIPPSLILIPFLLLAALALTPTTAASESTDPFTGIDGGRWWWRPPPGAGGGGGPGPERPYDMLELV
jgi:hypothetical protein